MLGHAGEYRRLSYWFDALYRAGSDDLAPRPALTEDRTADVCIVGAGFTGLWTAYYLASAHPEMSIVVLEQDIAGFGASGRNGGWCSALFPVSTGALAQRHGEQAALALRRAMVDTVDEVGRVAEAEGIQCDYLKGGTLAFVRSRAELVAARTEVSEAAAFGVDTLRFLGTDRIREVAPQVGAAAATVTPDCARIQPAALVRGLARAVERLGVRIYERTRVTGWNGTRVSAVVRDTGAQVRVDTGTVVNASEAYASRIRTLERSVLPLYSLMIATEPLPETFWRTTGIEQGTTFTDFRHLLVYGQRTADDRFAFGGRGARYHWGSAIRPGYDVVASVSRHLYSALVDLFPDARGTRITHSWGGPIGVRRDWHASVGLDADARYAWAGGYVGDGVATTNLAGRTLAQLIAGEQSPLTSLPWVGHRSPQWEAEPLRFIGANAGLAGMRIADVKERMTRRPSLAARLLAPLTGH